MNATDPVMDWNGIRSQLEERRARIAREISAYPTPIAGCDAHINALLAEREQVNEELNRLEAAARQAAEDGSRAALEAFVRSCPLIARG